MQSYIESKGYSWILETEDELDDEPQRPLLEELEIDVGDIVTKARWALKPPADVGEINDFWGPAAVVMLYAALVVWGQMRVVSWILSLWVFGGGTVWFLARVLGADRGARIRQGACTDPAQRIRDAGLLAMESHASAEAALKAAPYCSARL